jgi:hypothetical protein
MAGISASLTNRKAPTLPAKAWSVSARLVGASPLTTAWYSKLKSCIVFAVFQRTVFHRADSDHTDFGFVRPYIVLRQLSSKKEQRFSGSERKIRKGKAKK